MAYKRRCLVPEPSSRPPSSRLQTFSTTSSVPQSVAQSLPASPTLPPQKRISLRPLDPDLSSASSPGDQDVVRTYDEETEGDIHFREDSDEMNEIVMAIDMKDRGTIGCAYYIAREEKLCLMQDIKIAGLEIIDTLKLHIQPTVILIGTRSEEKLEEYLNEEARGTDQGHNASMYGPRSTMNIADR
jgi:DNA mismatch repair protein MSH5